MDVRFCTMQEPPAERQTCAAIDPDQPSTRSLERAKRTRAPLLTTDLHGWRSLGNERLIANDSVRNDGYN
jgi:hypothetical protein